MTLALLEESGNDYGIPVVPIKKAFLPGQAKATLRVCGDYSGTVYPQLETHRQPMPLPKDLMQKLGGGCGFSKIDLADAYNQINLAPESQRRFARIVVYCCSVAFRSESAQHPDIFRKSWDKLHKTCQVYVFT